MRTKNLIPVLLSLILASLMAALAPAGGVQAQGGRLWLPIDNGGEPAPPSLALVEADAGHIDLAAHIPGVWAAPVTAGGETYVRLSGDGFGHGTETGRPDLPVLRRSVEIPFGARVTLELLHAEYADYSLADLGLAHQVWPLQPSRPKSLEPQEEWPFVKDADFYRTAAFYPADVVAVAQEYVVRGHRALVVEVRPLAYNPATGQLRVFRDIRLRLHLTGSDLARTAALAQRYSSPAFDPLLVRQLLNYTRPAHPNAAVGYLIITADAYYDNMLPFVTLQQTRGFDVTITRLSAIGGGTNTDIKAYIQNAYDTWPTPPSYVLLVGDTDTMPGWNSVSAGEITDLYYATMDGGDDWVPDIGRGRFPVRSTDQVDIMVNKAIAYSQRTGDEDWMKKIAFVATCDQYTVAEGTHNYVINTYTDPEGYTGIFPNNPQPGGDQLYCVTHNATDTDIQNSINDERWAVIYSGHGGWTGWEMDYDADDVRALAANGVFPFVASHACITGDFDQTEVFGETWVLQDNKGALAFWGSSDSSYWDEDDVLERAAFDALFTSDPAPSITGMTYAGLAAVQTSYPGSARYYWETYNILGDPSINLFPEANLPHPGTLAGEVVWDTGTALIPVPDARVTASGWPTRTFQTTSDDAGRYSFILPEYTYTVTAQAYGFKTWITGSVQVMENQTTTLDIPLTPADYYLISGTIRDAVTGDPLWATLDIYGDPFDPPTTHIETDPATGFYSLTLAEDVTYTLTADALLHLPTTTVLLPLTGDQTVDLTLVPTTTQGGIVGWVRNANTGDPVSGATVTVDGTGLDDESDADGYFEILGLAPGVYTATASAALFSDATIGDIAVVTSNLALVTFQLPTAHMSLQPPAGLSVVLRQGRAVTRTLTISNSGQGLLDFEIIESRADFTTTTKTTGGPDPFGYTFRDSDEPDGPLFEWIDATDGTPLGLSDDGEAGVTLPFPFEFYGLQSSDLVIGNNGAILFGATSGEVSFTNEDLSSSSTDDIIAVFWDDIDSDTGDVYYKTVGTAPSRRFVIEWYDRPHYYYNTGDATFEMILYEESNDIKFQYLDTVFGDSDYDYGASATVGIRGSDDNYLQYSYNAAALHDGLAICFQYPGALPCDRRDIPWLTEGIVSGTVPARSELAVPLTFDAAVVTETGLYVGELTIRSNDPAAQPYLRYPVTMTVLPPLPSLSIAKTASAARVDVGLGMEYLITVTNEGGPATGLVISDALPSQTTFAWADGGGVLSGTQVIWKGLTLPANDALTVRYGVAITCVPSGTELVNAAYSVRATEWPTPTFGTPVTVTATADGVTAAFDFPTPAVVNWPVAFDNRSVNGTAFTWDFGDGYTATQAAPAHVYTAIGTYTVTLTARNLCASAAVSRPLTVHDYALRLAPTVAALSGDPGATVTYTLAVTNVGTISGTVDLRLGSHSWPAQVTPATVGPLAVGEGGEFQVRVTIPTAAAGDSHDSLTVTAAAADDPRTSPASATARLTTTANAVYGMALTPVTDTRSARPGETVTYTLHLVNAGNVADSFTIAGAGNVWPVNLPLTRTTLSGGAATDIPVGVTVPAGTLGGTTDSVRLTVTAQTGGGSGQAVLTTTATIVRGLALVPGTDAGTGDPGASVTYTLRLTNTGNVSDAFSLAVGGHLWTTTLSTAATGPLAPGLGQGVIVTVAIPFEAHSGDRDTAVVTATSQAGADEAMAVLTTQVAQQPVEFAMRKAAHTSQAAPGDIVTYTLTITNAGHDHLPVVLLDALPTRTVCLTGSVTGGLEFHDHPARLEFNGVLTSGHRLRFSYAARVLEMEAGPAVTITNRVTATVGGEVYTAQAAVLVPARSEQAAVYLPLVLRSR